MSRRPNRDNAADDYGMGNPYQTMCGRCDRQINDYKNQAVKQRGQWIHKTCAGGADDDQGNPPVRASSEVPRSEWWS